MKKDIKREAAVPRQMTKRQLSRHQREQQQRTIILAVAGAVAALIVGIMAFGAWREFIAIADEPVARVGDTTISTRSLSQLIGYYNNLYGRQIADVQAVVTENQGATDEAKKKLSEAATLRLQQLQSVSSQVDSQALDQLIEGELLAREAKNRPVEIAQVDLDRALIKQFDLGVDEVARQLADDGSEAPVVNPTPELLATARERQSKVLDNWQVLSQADFERLVLRPAAIRTKIQAEVAASVPSTTEQVKARHILFDSEQVAKENLALIKAGGLDFAEAAKQLSKDTASKTAGGDLGWFPRGIMDNKFEEAAFSLEPGQVSDVVASSFGFHIIKVEEKAKDRPVESDILSYQRSAAYSKWITEQRNLETNKVVYEYSEAKAKWARDNAKKAPVVQAKT